MAENITQHRQRVAASILVITFGIITAATASLANLWLYFEIAAWQMLFMGVAEAVVVAGLVLARNLAKKEQIDNAGYLSLVLAFLAFGAGELVHEGFTAVLAISGALMIILIGMIILPRRYYLWVPVLVLFAVYFWIVNRYQYWPRYDIRELMTFRIIIIVVVVILVGLGIWQFIRTIRYGTIRTRLLVTIIVLALGPAALIGSLSTYLGVQRSIQQTQTQLGSVANLKINQLLTWIDSLKTSITLSAPSADLLPATEILVTDRSQVDPVLFQEAYTSEKARYEQARIQAGAFSEIFLLDMAGTVLLSTDDEHEGRVEFGYAYFELGATGTNAAPPFQYPYTGELAMIVVTPIKNAAGEMIAILAAQADLTTLEEIMEERAGLGQYGESYLMVTKTVQLLTQTVFEPAQVGDYIYSVGISAAAEKGLDGEALYVNPWKQPVIGAYRVVPDMGMVLLSEQPQSEAFAPVYQSTIINALLTLGTVASAVVIALLVTARITRPIGDLAATAEQISKGNLDLEAKVEQQDEIGLLAGAFNHMTSQLRHIMLGLEDQVRERTAALEKRTSYLSASADVSRAVGSVLDPDQLIQQVVELIRDRFDLYYVGLFLLDPETQYAVLRAGTGMAGRVMLARQHRIKVGSGMIGWCILNRASRIAQRAELDASRLANPDLPDTRSEAAIPLISRGNVIGALTIQSTEQDIFEPETVNVFETMAEQVAVALDNARLFVQSQQTLDTLQAVYREMTLEGWRELIRATPDLGYRSEQGKALKEELGWRPELVATYHSSQPGDESADRASHQSLKGKFDTQQGSYYLGVPLVVRGNAIGVMGCYKSMLRGDWSEDEISFLEEVGQMVSIALESARLFTEVQARAESERVVAEVTEQFRKTLDIDTVLTTAVREVQRIMDLAEVEIRMSNVISG